MIVWRVRNWPARPSSSQSIRWTCVVQRPSRRLDGVEGDEHAIDATAARAQVEGADAQRVEGELMSYDLVPESAGGDTLVARVSAKEKTGLDELLEKVLLQADLLDLRANPDRAATGTVIEAGVEKGPYLRVP